MNHLSRPRWRMRLTAAVILAELAHLAWEHAHGGVPSHHLLNRADLPAISNWWGAVLLPGLAWFLAGRVHRRVAPPSGGAAALPPAVVARFAGALLFGVLLSVSFTNAYDTLAATLFLGMFALALLVPIYQAECVLGFVLGMTVTFGAVLPTLIGSLIAALSAVAQRGIRPLLVRVWSRFISPESLPE